MYTLKRVVFSCLIFFCFVTVNAAEKYDLVVAQDGSGDY